jgi:esterase/lipase superfamily enzyme
MEKILKKLKLYYATNRGHEAGRGYTHWNPSGYGKKFSSDGMENLRFGKVTVDADEAKLAECLRANVGFGIGDGNQLSGYLSKLADTPKRNKITAYKEKLDRLASDINQSTNANYGSEAMFAELQRAMMRGADVLVYIHGFNVAWNEAVGSALALQEMLNRRGSFSRRKQIVVLFSWPSNGEALPFVSYKSDRGDGRASGPSVGRAFLKFRDFLMKERTRVRTNGGELCNSEMNILCHSMGNYVLQNAVERIADFTPGSTMPRLFNQIFACAPDVNDNVLEQGQPLGCLHELAKGVNIYFNRGDAALRVSDYSKGNPDRLGTYGAAHLSQLHEKVHQVDCSPVIGGVVEHSYYLDGDVSDDIRMTLADVANDDTGRRRVRTEGARNAWTMDKR